MEAAFFDLDKTVIAKASLLAFGPSFYRQGLISRRTALRALYAQVVYLHLGASEERIAKLRRTVLRLTSGWDQTKVRAVVQEALDQVVQPIIYAEAAALMERHRRDGRLVIIVSASPEELVVPLSRYLGADGAIASRARIDFRGRYTGEMAFYAYGSFKAEAMAGLAAEREIDLAASWAYSDSSTDLPMLEAVGHPVAVNPDRDLARTARQKGWDILQWSKPVRMVPRAARRRRVTVVAPAAVVGFVAAGAGAAAIGWRVGHRVRRA